MVKFARIFVSLLAGFILFGAASDSMAKPVIFVPTTDDAYAWWAKPLTIRPLSKAVGGVSVDSINSWLAEHRGLREPVSLCYLEAVDGDAIVSPVRETQKEIDKTIAENPNSFQQTFVSHANSRFLIRVVAFETCGEEPRSGTGILITDASGLFKSFIENEFFFTRLSKRDDGLINVFGCYACGDVNELRYNPDGDEFYLKWIGH